MLRKNYVTIDLAAIRHNYALQKSLLPENTPVMAVVKADAYGHGMEEVALSLYRDGARHFAVALAEEGIALREKGVEGEILVLGAATLSAIAAAVQYDLTQTVFTPDMVHLIDREAIKQGKQALINIKLDTGMGRIGLRTEEEALSLRTALESCPRVKVTGIYTHFAAADECENGESLNDFTRQQLQRFQKLRSVFPQDIPLHAANSAMGILRPGQYGMVRQGISLYGYPPVPTGLDFRPALRWVSEVTYVKQIAPGDTVGYGCTFTAEREMRVATVAVGYGDGYHRAASNRAHMLVRGHRAPIVGRVCMDQTMIDVTDIPGVMPGDEVTLIGGQGEEFLSAEELAQAADTISWEVLLAISLRVPKFYTGKE